MLKNSPHPIKDNTYCCVPQCHTKASKNPEVRFHRFPGEKSRITKKGPNNQKYYCSRREEWKIALRIGKELSKRMVVCSLHFKPSDYVKYAYNSAKPQLKVTAVPTQNLPVPCLNDTAEAYQRQTEEKMFIDKEKAKKNMKKPETNKKPTRSSSRNNANIKETISATSSATEMPSSTANSADVQRKQTTDCFVPEYFKSKDYSPHFIAELLIPGNKTSKTNEENPSDKNEIYNNKSNQVVIKEEPPWSDGYVLNGNIVAENEKEHGVYNQILIKRENLEKEDNYSERSVGVELDVGDNEHEESSNSHIQKNSTLSRIENSCKEKNSGSIISEREKLFGLLLASEISILCENTELYIKTKQTIVNAIADAQMQLLTGEGNII